MATCDMIIKKDIAPSCDDLIVPGLEANGVIINRSEVDFGAVTFNSTRKNVVETFPLKSTKKGYKIQALGSQPFVGTNVSMAAGTYRNTFTNTVNIVILDNGPDVCADIIDGLANGEFVIILENKFKGLGKSEAAGDAAFQIFGYYQGLRAVEMGNDKWAEETEGGWSVSLQETKVPKSALFLYKTSYDATKQLFETLLSAGG